jgi:hypothetical protein
MHPRIEDPTHFVAESNLVNFSRVAFTRACIYKDECGCVVSIFFFREKKKGVLISDSYQGKQLTIYGKDILTHNDVKKIKLH